MSTTATATDPPAQGSVPRRWGWWPGIVLVAMVTALATGWGLTRDPLEPYYAASVRAMASPDLMAVQSSAVASVFAYPTGEEVLPIGGFTGTGPSPTLDQLRADVAVGRFHVVVSFPGTDPRLVWVDEHCRALPSKDPTFRVHDCSPAAAARGQRVGAPTGRGPRGRTARSRTRRCGSAASPRRAPGRPTRS
jgi:hypothetical protein